MEKVPAAPLGLTLLGPTSWLLLLLLLTSHCPPHILHLNWLRKPEQGVIDSMFIHSLSRESRLRPSEQLLVPGGEEMRGEERGKRLGEDGYCDNRQEVMSP